MVNIKKGDLILVDTGYLQQVESVEDNGEVFTCDSRFSYCSETIKDDLQEVYRKNKLTPDYEQIYKR